MLFRQQLNIMYIIVVVLSKYFGGGNTLVHNAFYINPPNIKPPRALYLGQTKTPKGGFIFGGFMFLSSSSAQ